MAHAPLLTPLPKRPGVAVWARGVHADTVLTRADTPCMLTRHGVLPSACPDICVVVVGAWGGGTWCTGNAHATVGAALLARPVKNLPRKTALRQRLFLQDGGTGT